LLSQLPIAIQTMLGGLSQRQGLRPIK
jgi:hypothetical protein